MKRPRNDLFSIPQRIQARRGAAFLMLVAVIALVVVGATTSLVQSEVQSRRGTKRWIRAQVMTSAVEQATRSGITSDTAWSLPLADTDDEFLEVSMNDESNEIVVRWIRRGDVIDQMIREVAPAPTDSEKIE
jgi:type II secretory pathway component PulK